MNTADLLVILGGIAAIVWVNWYFFYAGRAPAAAAMSATGVQEVRIRIQGGYDPARVRVKRGVPVRLVFDRQETSGCSEEVVLPDFGIKRFLPAHRTTSVEFTPERAGSYEFTCGMSMLRGRLDVEDEEDGA
ncbi:MAG: cupredoxin domain-containing protein [Gemmatimonadetes bacterium]|nr:cupredoxin domain-containing protein [Gemmatimonadota bacterium]